MNIDDFGTSPQTNNTLTGRHTEQPVDPSNDVQTEGAIIYKQWGLAGSKTWTPVSETITELVPGVYSCSISDGKLLLTKKDIKVDDLLKFEDSISEEILDEVSSFWKRCETFKKYGFLHRRGYLFYGPQGSGKTVIIQQIIADIVAAKGIVFMCEAPQTLNYALTIFRQVEPLRQVVCLFEDIDAIIDQYGENSLLALLDGENQIDRVLNIGSTNYPEKLDARIVARPRRFDRIIKIGMPNAKIRGEYFKKKLKIDDAELKLWVSSSEGFSFAACAELVISVKCLGNDFNESVSTIAALMTTKVSSADFNEKPGFKGFGSC